MTLDFRPDVYKLGETTEWYVVYAEGRIRDTETDVVWIRFNDGTVRRFEQKTGRLHVLPRELNSNNNRGQT
jgi:hypothetical protein